MTPAKVPKQGQSVDTEHKERGIAAAISINLRIFMAKFGHDPRAVYQHFDLNAGNGMNAEFNCIGSPLAFVREIDAANCRRYRAHFVDINRDAVSQLLARPQIHRDGCFVHFGDNRDFAEAIPDLIALTEKPRWAIGSVLIDPNGADVPIPQIARLAEKCPRLDFVVNWNSTIFKRCLDNPRVPRKGRLQDLIEAANKSHWLIRRPVSSHQWTLLVGRNTPVRDHRAMGFYRLDSEAGQEIFDVCNLTKKEYDAKNPHPELPL